MNFELLKLLVKDFEIILDELILNIFYRCIYYNVNLEIN